MACRLQAVVDGRWIAAFGPLAQHSGAIDPDGRVPAARPYMLAFYGVQTRAAGRGYAAALE